MRPACRDTSTRIGVALGALVLIAIAPLGESSARSAAAPSMPVAAPVAAAGSAAQAAELGRQACASCHLGDRPGDFLFASFRAFQQGPAPRPDECARCHVNNALAAAAPRPAAWLPLASDTLARVRRFHPYVASPALVFAVDAPDASGELQRLPRFDTCGLERFLAAPLARSGAAAQSMFPVEPARRRALLASLASDLAPCESGTASAAELERGRTLYADLGCAGCHTGAGAGPRLRLGLPLLARAYVRARVRLGSTAAPRDWTTADGKIVPRGATGGVAMPAHSELSDADLDALHAYIASDRSDVPAAEPRLPAASIDVPDGIRLALFRDVQRRVFDTSCRHCHSDDAEAQTIIQGVFGDAASDGDRRARALALPVSRLPTPADSPSLRSALEPAPGCGASRLVARLRARAHEWSGEPAGAVRGMPLTLPPLPEAAIRLVEVWTAAGCPSDTGDLCTACAPVGQS